MHEVRVCAKLEPGVFLKNIPYLASFASQNPVQQRCLVLSPRLQGENIIGPTNPGSILCQKYSIRISEVLLGRDGLIPDAHLDTGRERLQPPAIKSSKAHRVGISGNSIDGPISYF